jgi:hypothetical protein
VPLRLRQEIQALPWQIRLTTAALRRHFEMKNAGFARRFFAMRALQIKAIEEGLLN